MENCYRILLNVLFAIFPFFAWSSSYELVVYVSAQGLKYETGELFFESLLKQGISPRVGHAWVSLSKKDDQGQIERVEGGHSGEFGVIAPQYLDRLLFSAEDPNNPNPIQVLYEPLEDGIFEQGSGGYLPTYAASFDLTEEGYRNIHSLLQEGSSEYPFHKWSLVQYNCVRFVSTCLGRIGIALDTATEMVVSQKTKIRGAYVPMWTDRSFSSVILDTPEKLESELRRLVSLGVAQKVPI